MEPYTNAPALGGRVASAQNPPGDTSQVRAIAPLISTASRQARRSKDLCAFLSTTPDNKLQIQIGNGAQSQLFAGRLMTPIPGLAVRGASRACPKTGQNDKSLCFLSK
jgi:hypothetical protein